MTNSVTKQLRTTMARHTRRIVPPGLPIRQPPMASGTTSTAAAAPCDSSSSASLRYHRRLRLGLRLFVVIAIFIVPHEPGHRSSSCVAFPLSPRLVTTTTRSRNVEMIAVQTSSMSSPHDSHVSASHRLRLSRRSRHFLPAAAAATTSGDAPEGEDTTDTSSNEPKGIDISQDARLYRVRLSRAVGIE